GPGESATASRPGRGLGAALGRAVAAAASAQVEPATPLQRVTFDEAVQRAIVRHPTVGEAAQAIVRAQGLLDQARAVFRPLVVGGAGETVLDAPRGFAGNITQPQRQAAFSGTASYSPFALSDCAGVPHASDQAGLSRISADQVRP